MSAINLTAPHHKRVEACQKWGVKAGRCFGQQLNKGSKSATKPKGVKGSHIEEGSIEVAAFVTDRRFGLTKCKRERICKINKKLRKTRKEIDDSCLKIRFNDVAGKRNANRIHII